jgi:hypothetical protein
MGKKLMRNKISASLMLKYSEATINKLFKMMDKREAKHIPQNVWDLHKQHAQNIVNTNKYEFIRNL